MSQPAPLDRRLKIFDSKDVGHSHNRRGNVLIMTTLLMVVLMGFASFAVDYGHVSLVRDELQLAADAAARYAVGALPQGPAAVRARAKAAAAENTVNGAPLVLTDADIELGIWDEDDNSFTKLSPAQEATADAVRITVRCSQSNNNGLKLTFGSAFGAQIGDLTRQAIAIPEVTEFATATQVSVAGKASPFTAGLPNGIVWGDFNDTTPNVSPPQVTGITLTAGKKLVFRGASGSTKYGGGTSKQMSIEGDTNWILDQAAVFNFGRTRAPAHALMGVFLDDNDPRNTPAASQKNYTTEKSRNFNNHKPKLKQVFYIGDGVNSKGAYQTFVVPAGATRLFLGTMDEKGRWSDNTGTLSVEVGEAGKSATQSVPTGRSIQVR